MSNYSNSSLSMHLLSGLFVGKDEKWTHGIELLPSTGTPEIAVRSTAANVSLKISAKGSGNVTVQSSGTTYLRSTAGVYLGSTTPASTWISAKGIKGIFASTYTWAVAQAASSIAPAEITIPSTTADINPGDMVTYNIDFQTGQSTAMLCLAGHRFSTVDTSRLTIVVRPVGSSISGSNSGKAYIQWIDLT